MKKLLFILSIPFLLLTSCGEKEDVKPKTTAPTKDEEFENFKKWVGEHIYCVDTSRQQYFIANDTTLHQYYWDEATQTTKEDIDYGIASIHCSNFNLDTIANPQYYDALLFHNSTPLKVKNWNRNDSIQVECYGVTDKRYLVRNVPNGYALVPYF